MNVVDSSGWLEYFADAPNSEFFAAAIEDAETSKRCVQNGLGRFSAGVCVPAPHRGRPAVTSHRVANPSFTRHRIRSMRTTLLALGNGGRVCVPVVWTAASRYSQRRDANPYDFGPTHFEHTHFLWFVESVPRP